MWRRLAFSKSAPCAAGWTCLRSSNRPSISRVTVEQAKGAIAERAGVDMETAFAWLRSYSRANSLRMAEVALAVVERTLSVDALRVTETTPSDLSQA